MSATATDAALHFLFEAKPLWTGQIGSGGVADGTTQTIPLQSASNLDSGDVYVVRLNRVDSNGTKTTSPATNTEVLYGKLSGTNLIDSVRGAEGTAQAWAAGTVVEVLFTSTHWNKMIEFLGVEHSATGVHDATKVAMLAGSQTFTGAKTFSTAPLLTFGTEAAGDTFYGAADGTLTRLAKGTDGQVLTLASGAPSWAAAAGGGASYWTDVPGTPTRVSDTQFTITDTSNANLYDLLFKKGVVLKWLESTTFQTAMVISSSYSANAVTINIVGDSLTAGFTAMKYCIVKAQKETFIIAGTLAAATDITKTWYPPSGVYLLSVDAFVKTAGTTNATIFDLNVSGTTKFTAKPQIASAATSGLNFVADTPSTEVAAAAPVTVDVDSVSTTAPIEAYIDLFYVPSDWRYR